MGNELLKDDDYTVAASLEGGGFKMVSAHSQKGVRRDVPNGIHIITIQKDSAGCRYYQLRIVLDYESRAEGYTGLDAAYEGSYIEQAKDAVRLASMVPNRADMMSVAESEDVSGRELRALRAVFEAAKACHEMEHAYYVEKNIPTSKWMADLARAIEVYERLQKN